MPVSTSIQSLSLPLDLPLRIVSSHNVGQGAYAFIRKAVPLEAYEPVIAVKFIHKQNAYKLGRIKPKNLQAEVALHKHVSDHQNIIRFITAGEDPVWAWIAMELAEGDLFDKVEADIGVPQSIAHFYFKQLIGAVSWMHSKGVAHRDIKPENILLLDGDLKIADFGLAALFQYQNQRKTCTTICGSPPYMAPEVVPQGGFNGQKTLPYDGDKVDIWSCGVVLFVLLVGNTPWDEPTQNSPEFDEYLRGDTSGELWCEIPTEALSLLRGMLRVDPSTRFSLEDVRRHPWFTSSNPHLNSDGRAANPVTLATQMFQSLRIDFDADPFAPSQRGPASQRTAMEVDTPARAASSQPDTPMNETHFDWDRPARIHANDGVSASQPIGPQSQIATSRFLDDPLLLQFSQTPAVPMSLTQQARHFRDILPPGSMARFLSFMDYSLLLPLISEALSQLGIPVPAFSQAALSGQDSRVYVPVKTVDQRKCPLTGTIIVDKIDDDVLEARFTRGKGDPLEWRRLFKKVAVLCKDGILRPPE